MVGLVIVSHSAALAGGVVELARQMGGGQVAVEAAGGMSEPEGAIGTDVELVQAAIERAASDDGVLVLMDLGSAVMSAEMAAEMVGMTGDVRVLLCDAPLVEGAVAAAARAGAGAPLEEVAAEARSALRMKVAALGGDEAAEQAGGGADDAAAVAEPGEDAQELRLDVTIPLGLHARPAARIVETAARFDARITLSDATTGRGPADARSLTGVVTLAVRQGHAVLVRASGPDAGAALAAFRELAAEGFGDEPGGAGPGSGAAAGGVGADGAAPSGQRPAAGERASSAERGGPAEPFAVGEPAGPAEPPAAGALLQGVPVAPGIAIGPARPLAPAGAAVPEDDAPAGAPDEERARLDAARDAARADVQAARARIAREAGEGEAAIFDAHLLLLDDAVLVDRALQAIAGGAGAARAWAAAVEAAAAAFDALDDAYLRERAADVRDVGARVLRRLTGADDGAGPTAPGILVAADLTPGDAAALERDLVQGIALARGGATSHAAILARALGIPSVAGLGDGLVALGDGTPLVLDGAAGTLEVDPAPDALAARERDRAAAEQRRDRARGRAHEPATTRDGTTLEVAANIGSPAEARAAVEAGADGVGLLRTEFLFLDRDTPPTEDEQRAVLEEIAGALGGRPLIVRTLDAGADKPLRYLAQAPEENPFLGVRGVRLGLARPELLRTQLRAILAVAAAHPLRIMLPMVATLGELRAARTMLDEVRAELGVGPVELGIMVEVPAVAVGAERFAREADFFSIGTNDLGQYTMAAERGNPAVAALSAGPVPAILRLVHAVVEGAAAHGRWVGVCGELAGDPAAAVLLAGLGVDELSMAAPLIPEAKEALRGLDLVQARAVARAALELDDAPAAARAAAGLLAAPADADG